MREAEENILAPSMAKRPKTEYEKKPENKFYNQDKVSSIDTQRRKAAHSGNALEYMIYCNAIGVEPEEQFTELYSKGIIEYERNKNTKKVTDLEFHVERSIYGNRGFKPQKTKRPKALSEDQHKFLKRSELFDRNAFNQIDGKKQELIKYHLKFRKGQEQDLSELVEKNEGDTSVIGRIYNNLVKSYTLREQYGVKQEK
ncbi:MAG TPA: hypothetical protein VEC16_01095 [Alphaproteobacteria bacterium]|nr:hypothetical protein [Alphaproteobacteria bacterium]